MERGGFSLLKGATVAVASVVFGYCLWSKSRKGGEKPYSGPLRICVYGSSSKLTPKPYIAAAEKLGRAIADKGLILVNGGGKTGVMGAVNKGGRAADGKILGVIHSMWIGEAQYTELDELIVADGGYGLHARKEGLGINSDALIALPGGTGTFEELLEADHPTPESRGRRALQPWWGCLVCGLRGGGSLGSGAD